MTHTHTTYHEAVHAALHLLADDMGYEIPTHADIAQERTYLRALMNMRDPAPLPYGYQEAEAIVLDTERERKGTATWEDAMASSTHPRIALWRGDITRLEVDAIVNAANSALLGCRAPGHTCIDNAIHAQPGSNCGRHAPRSWLSVHAATDLRDSRRARPSSLPASICRRASSFTRSAPSSAEKSLTNTVRR